MERGKKKAGIPLCRERPGGRLKGRGSAITDAGGSAWVMFLQEAVQLPEELEPVRFAGEMVVAFRLLDPP